MNIKEIWHDPVWSKVIAGCILFMLSSALVYANSSQLSLVLNQFANYKFEFYAWHALVFLTLLVSILIAIRHYSHKRTGKKIFVIASNVNNNLFFLFLINYIPIEFNNKYDVVMKLIDDKEDAFDEVAKNILKNNSYAAGIIVPSSLTDSQNSTFKQKLHEFIRKFRKPLIIADWSKEQLDSTNKLNGVKNIYTIYFDNEQGGAEAGQAVIDYYKGQGNKQFRIQIIRDGTQPKRAESFRASLANDKRFVIQEDIELVDSFDKANMKTIIKAKLKEALSLNTIDLIFCLNDTITLYCLEILDDSDFDQFKKPKVIGYDATIITQRVCEQNRKRNKGNLVNTIHQNDQLLAQRITRILTDKIEGNNSDDETSDIKLKPVKFI